MEPADLWGLQGPLLPPVSLLALQPPGATALPLDMTGVPTSWAPAALVPFLVDSSLWVVPSRHVSPSSNIFFSDTHFLITNLEQPFHLSMSPPVTGFLYFSHSSNDPLYNLVTEDHYLSLKTQQKTSPPTPAFSRPLHPWECKLHLSDPGPASPSLGLNTQRTGKKQCYEIKWW